MTLTDTRAGERIEKKNPKRDREEKIQESIEFPRAAVAPSPKLRGLKIAAQRLNPYRLDESKQASKDRQRPGRGGIFFR